MCLARCLALWESAIVRILSPGSGVEKRQRMRVERFGQIPPQVEGEHQRWEDGRGPGMPGPAMPRARGALPSLAGRTHLSELAQRPRARPERLRPRGEAAAGAWGVAAPGELRGCAGCEPGARATDVAWAREARALVKTSARFRAHSALLLEVPSTSPRPSLPPRAKAGRGAGVSLVREGQARTAHAGAKLG